jgi:hypothetical protein
MLMSRRGQAATVTSKAGMAEGRLVIRPHPWRQRPPAYPPRSRYACSMEPAWRRSPRVIGARPLPGPCYQVHWRHERPSA